MKYTVDEIINSIAVLISDSGVKKEVSISVLPCNIKENDVLVYSNNKYVINNELKNNRMQTIKEKMAMLKKNND